MYEKIVKYKAEKPIKISTARFKRFNTVSPLCLYLVLKGF